MGVEKLHNEELHGLCCSPTILRVIKLRKMRCAWLVETIEVKGVYRFLVRKPEGKSPLGRPKNRWDDNNKAHLQEVECGVMVWIELAQDRDRLQSAVNAVMNLRVQ
jgi:hypothetical protein